MFEYYYDKLSFSCPRGSLVNIKACPSSADVSMILYKVLNLQDFNKSLRDKEGFPDEGHCKNLNVYFFKKLCHNTPGETTGLYLGGIVITRTERNHEHIFSHSFLIDNNIFLIEDQWINPDRFSSNYSIKILQ